MQEKKILRKTLLWDTQNDFSKEELKNLKKEEAELYLFLRGGFTAK